MLQVSPILVLATLHNSPQESTLRRPFPSFRPDGAATSVRVCHCLLSKWIFIWNEKHKQTNKPKDKQKKRTGHDCQQYGARKIALLPIIWISCPAPWMYLVDELSESTIAYQKDMNVIYYRCVFALLAIEFDPARFFLLPLCNFSQGGNLAQHPCF